MFSWEKLHAVCFKTGLLVEAGAVCQHEENPSAVLASELLRGSGRSAQSIKSKLCENVFFKADAFIPNLKNSPVFFFFYPAVA